ENIGRRIVALRHCRRPGADCSFLIDGHDRAPYDERLNSYITISSLGYLSLSPNVYALGQLNSTSLIGGIACRRATYRKAPRPWRRGAVRVHCRHACPTRWRRLRRTPADG